LNKKSAVHFISFSYSHLQAARSRNLYTEAHNRIIWVVNHSDGS